MSRVSERGRRAAASRIALGAVLLALLGGSESGAAVKDRPYRTPIAHGSATARTAVSAAELGGALGRAFRGRGGAWVADAGTDQILFQRGAGKARALASNMKLFTTATALSRFGPDQRIETTVWAGDDHSDGIVSEGLFLVGAGDPTLSAAGLTKLAARVRSAGVTSVQGPLLYDDFFLDQRSTVPQHGIRREGVGTLSALTLSGAAGAKTAAQRFDQALRRAGVAISKKVQRRAAAPESAGATLVAELQSPTIADLARRTNVPSNNYLAEMLLKDVGGAFGGAGSTRAGVGAVQRFVAEQGGSVRAENGSGLSRRDTASPSSVGALLDSMLEVDENGPPEKQDEQERRRDTWVSSLAVAGRTGTLAHRMRGSAAANNCRAKTGTLNGVSALSGYCFRSAVLDAEHAVVFSILMSGDVGRAHRAQDQMTALMARYAP
jgi:D-alanyl-D-alanine carboxypeptidase/D-alanyl-D-alanine-endopeptidase (penicillin-binding protein 4)